MDTIFALSSGAPPAGIAVIRVSGPAAGSTLRELIGRLPAPRRATSARLRGASGDELDRALVLWLPGPATATGEDVAELHLHGGRAVIAAVERRLAGLAGLRRADAGEFTRRAFANGRIDLAEAEGLADLLAAETELQRRSAMAMAGGQVSRQIGEWKGQLLRLSAELETQLDFSDEDDAADPPEDFVDRVGQLATQLASWLERPRAERLREGVRIVLGGPPNSGKSTLFNALVESEAAITAPHAGTTRDLIERSVAIEGVPLTFIDTAGLRESGAGEVETIGIARARAALDGADLILWLGEEGGGPAGSWEIEAMADRADRAGKRAPIVKVSAISGSGIDELKRRIVSHARDLLPAPGEAALAERQHRLLAEAHAALDGATAEADPLLLAERLRIARLSFDRLLGGVGTEDMLDALFGRFCIGK